MSCPSGPAGGANPSTSNGKATNIMQHGNSEVVGGVDTHLEVHVAAVVDNIGRILATESFPTTPAGYRQLLSWLRCHGSVTRVGVEGTGAYGAGLCRHLTAEGVDVVEVNRPDRQRRRRRGKSDTVDAEAAARAALNGEATTVPKAGNGEVEGLRALRIARKSAIKARTQATLQIRDLVLTAPEDLRTRLEPLPAAKRVQICAKFRPGDTAGPEQAIKLALRHLARRYEALTIEISDLDGVIEATCVRINPALLGAKGVGPEVAATLLVTAGDNPERMHSEAAFAALCGAAPIEASSGRITRHRLSRGGNRQGNNALWRIAMVRMATDPRTKEYVAKRTADGKTKKEIIRCLQRYIAREIHRLLVNDQAVITGENLRAQRKQHALRIDDAAHALNTWPIAISRLERSLTHNTELATRYQHWLDQQAA